MTRLLIVDDSALVRKLLSEVFSAEPDFEVEVARDGEQALQALREFKPDVITLDIHMPGMDGLACLDRIMVARPTPVVMVSALTAEGARETLDALALGAVDFIEKPTGALSLKMHELAPRLVATVRTAAGARIRQAHRLSERVRARFGAEPARPQRFQRPTVKPALPRKAHDGGPGVVIVGCSTGGPPALDTLLGGLPPDFPWPVLVAQHMPAAFTGPLSKRLNGLCALEVVEVTRSTPVVPGFVYIGRGDADLILSRRADGLTALAAPASAEFRWHPSVDRLVDSALELLPADRIVGVLMTGMGSDGAASMAKVHAGGGVTLAESEKTAVVWGMPGELVRLQGASTVLPLPDLGPALVESLAIA